MIVLFFGYLRQLGTVPAIFLLGMLLFQPALSAQDPEKINPSETPEDAVEAELLRQARRTLAQGRLEEGVKLLRVLKERNPALLEARLLLGSSLALLARRSEAIGELEEVIRAHPEHAPAYVTLGQILTRFGEIPLAQQAFERGISLDPEVPEPRVHLALVLAQQQRFEEAGQQLDLAIDRLEQREEAAYPHLLRGKIYNELNQTEKAVLHFRKATELRAGYFEAYLDLGLTQRRLSDSKAALAAFLEAVKIAPDQAEANHYVGREYLALDQPDLAVPYLRKAIQADPENESITYNLARALQLQGKRQESQELFERFAQLQEDSREARSHALQITELSHEALELQKQGRLAEAEEKLRTALQIDPGHSSIRSNLGLLLCRTGRWREGLRELQQAHDMNPDDPNTRKALTIALDRAEEQGIDLEGEHTTIIEEP